MTLVFYISGHGFGHASRDVEVIHAIAESRPGLRVIARTAVPSSFFDVSARVAIEVQPLSTDPGVVQIDSIRIDEDATAREATAFYRDFDRRAGAEAQILAELEADLVVGDVPPLAFAAAARAGVPSVLLANFTWDWIYEGYPAIPADHAFVLELIRRAHATCTVALRLPFHGGFAGVHRVIDIPLIARRSARDPEETRRQLGIQPGRLMVLVSFSRYGIALPLRQLADERRLTLLVTDHEGEDPAHNGDALIRMAPQGLTASGLRYEDLVAAAHVVVSKPGYGIIAECIANGAALLYTSRGRFVEQDLLVREMPGVLRCRPIATDDLLEGRWWGDIRALLDQPAPDRRIRIDGAAVAAAAILAHAGARTPVAGEHP